MIAGGMKEAEPKASWPRVNLELQPLAGVLSGLLASLATDPAAKPIQKSHTHSGAGAGMEFTAVMMRPSAVVNGKYRGSSGSVGGPRMAHTLQAKGVRLNN